MSETVSPPAAPPPAPSWEPQMPAQVRAAAARAEELAREAQLVPEPGDNSGGSEPGEQLTTVVETRETPDLVVDRAPVDSSPGPGATTTPEWEQRYNTLQGKYNSELPELRGQIRSLQDLIASMQRAQSQAEVVQRTTPIVSPEDIESYGQDLVTASQRWAEAHLGPRFADYERRLSQVESGGQQLARHSAAQGVEHALDREIADWRQVNTDPKFILWLDQTDPFTGQKRQNLLNDAYAGGDAARTIAFFRAYRAEQTAVSPSNGAGIQSNHTGNGSAPPVPAERLPLAELAVPGRGQQSAQPAPGAPEKRMWTNGEIAAFYRQRTAGRWHGREAQADQLEQEIFAAAAEGRVRP